MSMMQLAAFGQDLRPLLERKGHHLLVHGAGVGMSAPLSPTAEAAQAQAQHAPAPPQQQQQQQQFSQMDMQVTDMMVAAQHEAVNGTPQVTTHHPSEMAHHLHPPSTMEFTTSSGQMLEAHPQSMQIMSAQTMSFTTAPEAAMRLSPHGEMAHVTAPMHAYPMDIQMTSMAHTMAPSPIPAMSMEAFTAATTMMTQQQSQQQAVVVPSSLDVVPMVYSEMAAAQTAPAAAPSTTTTTVTTVTVTAEPVTAPAPPLLEDGAAIAARIISEIKSLDTSKQAEVLMEIQKTFPQLHQPVMTITTPTVALEHLLGKEAGKRESSFQGKRGNHHKTSFMFDTIIMIFICLYGIVC